MSRVDELCEVVAPRILERAAEVSALLRGLGVPHALIGGLAVGVHGHPRATKDHAPELLSRLGEVMG